MKQFRSFVKKEFHHILRDRRTLFILLFMPIAQIIIFGFALTNEVKNAQIAVMDNARDADAASLITQISRSRYFNVEQVIYTKNGIEEAFKGGKIKMVMVLPQHFGSDLQHLNH